MGHSELLYERFGSGRSHFIGLLNSFKTRPIISRIERLVLDTIDLEWLRVQNIFIREFLKTFSIFGPCICLK